MNALQFGRIGPAIAIGERDTRMAITSYGQPERSEVSVHAA